MALFSKRKHRKKVTEYTEKDYDKAIKDLDREVAEESDFFGKKSFTETASTVTAVIKAVVYIAFIVVAAAALSYLALTSLNDIFAFVKEDREVEVTIPEYVTSSEMSEILGDAGVIEHPWLFRLYAKMKHVDENSKVYNFEAGTYTVSSSMNYDELFLSFVKRSKVTTVRITVPEGYTVDDIINLFLAQDIGTKEGWIDAVNNHDFGDEFPFIADIPERAGRYYRLEGYLFPDTYDFYTGQPEYYYLRRMLVRFDEIFTDTLRKKCEELGYSIDEMLTVASIVEKEAYFANDYPICSSVIWNRLKKSATYPNLECDSTVVYALSHAAGKRITELKAGDLQYDDPYNTYKYAGLTPSPICNPSYNTIICAIYPETTDYYFFVTDAESKLLPAKTLAEHNANVAKVKAEKEAAAAAAGG